MSRSFKKTPIVGNACSKSERFAKKNRSHRERVALRKAISHEDEADVQLIPWDEWDTGRDGKHRFNPEEYPEFLRK